MSERKSKKQTYFNDSWLNEKECDINLWVLKGSTSISFRCKVCKGNKDKTLGEAGVGALRKHSEGQAHLKNMELYKKTLNFFAPRNNAAKSDCVTNQDTGNADALPCSSYTKPAEPIPSFFNQRLVEEAHIVWALNCVKNGYSDNSADDFGNVLRRICPTDKVAEKFQMGRKKLMYVVNYGLFPYFKQWVKDVILKSPFIVTLFDESLNKTSQKSEMDLHVRYWDVNEKKVVVRYWNSKFLGHARSDDLVKAFNDGLNELDMTKMVQISMDGPNVNLKFLCEMNKLRQNDELPSLIDIGSCNLHVIHGAFKSGSESSGWNLHKILKGSFKLLHDTPARRDDYFNMTASSEYPLQFCGTRWVEDKMVAEKLIKLWPNMIKLFDFWSSLCKSKQPSSKSYENTKKGIEDPLTVAKLHFFSFVAGLLQPFLKLFQGDGPMVPFLCNSIRGIYISLLELIVKAKVLENVRSYDLVTVVNNNDNLLNTKSIHMGFAAESEIKSLLQTKVVTPEQVMKMKNEAQVFIKKIINKMSERNPMSTVIARSADAFDPKVLVNEDKDKLKQKVKNLIQKLVGLKLIEFKAGDKALAEYTKFLQSEVTQSREKFIGFKSDECRLDDFYFKKLKIEDSYSSFAMILKIIFCMSHGQASVERGFNDNNVVLKDNMGENTIIARRFIKNYLRVNAIEPYTIQINNELLKSVKCARQRYEVHLEEQKKSAKGKQKGEELVKVDIELETITTQCSALEDTIKKLDTSFVVMMKKAEEKNMMHFVIEGNALKRKSEEKVNQLSVLKKRLDELQIKKRKLV